VVVRPSAANGVTWVCGRWSSMNAGVRSRPSWIGDCYITYSSEASTQTKDFTPHPRFSAGPLVL